MQTGRVSQAVYERSMQRPCRLMGMPAGEEKSGPMAQASAAGILRESCQPTEQMLAAQALNALPLTGVKEWETVSFSLVLPNDMEERELRDITVRIALAAERAGAVIRDMSCRVSDAVRHPVLTLWAGAMKAEENPERGDVSSSDLVMAGYAGEAGTAVLARDCRSCLEKMLPGDLLDQAALPGEDFLIRKRVRDALQDSGCLALAAGAAGEGGVFGALWELGESLGCGFEADLQRMPIRQETVEICEALDLNPYQLYGTGALLLVCPDGRSAARQLLRSGVPASCIGHLQRGRERVIRNRSVRRSLEKPQQDMLFICRDRMRQG